MTRDEAIRLLAASVESEIDEFCFSDAAPRARADAREAFRLLGVTEGDLGGALQ